jgi:glyoxylase-like metal-dependent hydrolase (beta-lactamase superfamily II)
VIVGDGGNVAVMPTSEGVVLVDDKFAQDGPQILAKVKSVSDKPIRYVLNTHHHGDHTGGNAGLLAANAEIILHKNARANMVASSPESRISRSATNRRFFWVAKRLSQSTLDAAIRTAMS